MIFYSFFTERWLSATDGLTLEQEAVYLRLLNWMYRNECPLPADHDECCRIARVPNLGKPYLLVTWILSRFFSLSEAGYTQAKALHEISRFQQGEPAREARRQLDKERQARNRGEQSRLYAVAREMGLATRPRMKLSELRELVGEPAIRVVRAGAQPAASVPASAVDAPADEPADVSERQEAQNPRPTTHSVLTYASQPADAGVAARLGEGPQEAVPTSEQPTPERLGRAVRALRAGGLVGINSGHPLLHALLAAGCDDDALTWASANAVGKGKGFAYVLAVLEGQMRDAAQSKAEGLARPADRNRVSEWAPGLEAAP